MFGLQMLDVAIGLVFIYLVLALACTAFMEALSGFTDRRRRNLAAGILNLLRDKQLVKAFYEHPLILSMREDGTPPSYIPPQIFAATVVDLLVPVTHEIQEGLAPDPGALPPAAPPFVPYPDAKSLRLAIGNIRNAELATLLLIMLNDAGDDVGKFKAALETWFTDAMDRTSAWYKQKTSRWILGFAFVLTVLTNADTIDLAQQLYTTPSVRQALVAQAQEYVEKNPPPAQPANPTAAANPSVVANKPAVPPAGTLESIQKLQDLGLKLGWKNYSSCNFQFKSPQNKKFSCTFEILAKIIGLLITTLAVSQGAPFWFDTLNKIISIRGVGKSPDEKTAKK